MRKRDKQKSPPPAPAPPKEKDAAVKDAAGRLTLPSGTVSLDGIRFRS